MNKKNKILEIAGKFEAEAVIITDNSTRYWATGFRSSAGIAIISTEEIALFLDGRYTEKAYSEKPDAVIYPCVNGISKTASEYVGNKGICSGKYKPFFRSGTLLPSFILCGTSYNS